MTIRSSHVLVGCDMEKCSQYTYVKINDIEGPTLSPTKMALVLLSGLEEQGWRLESAQRHVCPYHGDSPAEETPQVPAAAADR